MPKTNPKSNVKSADTGTLKPRRKKPFQYQDFEKINPLRSLDWRWQRARNLLEKGHKASGQGDDRLTLRAQAYLKHKAQGATNRKAARSQKSYADIRDAEGVYDNGGVLRWLLEAMLLARQDTAVIAKALNLSPAAVDSYEKLFFCVRDRLHSKSYIMMQAMKKVLRDEVSATDSGELLRYLGYFGGGWVLETIAPILLAGVLGEQVTCGSPVYSEQLKQKIQKWVATITSTIFGNNLDPVIESLDADIESERKHFEELTNVLKDVELSSTPETLLPAGLKSMGEEIQVETTSANQPLLMQHA